MPKMKTHRAAAKRFSITGTGKIKRWNKNKTHLLNKKPRKLKRRLRKASYISKADYAKVRQLIPYK